MANQLTIRDFLPEDRSTFLRMCGQFYHSPAVLHPLPRAAMEHTFEEILRGTPLLRGLMLLVDGAPAGYCQLSFSYSNEADGLVAWLEELYLEPSARGRGFGSRVLAWLAEEYKGKVSRWRLEVTEENTDAQRLYERFGYEKLGYLQYIRETPIEKA